MTELPRVNGTPSQDQPVQDLKNEAESSEDNYPTLLNLTKKLEGFEPTSATETNLLQGVLPKKPKEKVKEDGNMT